MYIFSQHKLKDPFFYLSVVCSLFTVSIACSKAGMNLFGALLILFSLALTWRQWSQLSLNYKRVILSAFSLFGLGLLASYLSQFNIADIKLYARNNAYLLVIPGLLFFLSDSKNQTRALLLLTLTTTLSSLLSIYNFIVIHDFSLEARALGFLDYSRHVNVLLLSIAFLLVYLFRDRGSYQLKAGCGLCLMIMLASLIISGTRGGWVGLAVMLAFFVLTIMRRYTLHVLCAAACIVLMAGIALPDKVAPLYERATSIFDTTNNLSNSTRLTMWKGAARFISANMTEAPKTFIFGTGLNQSESSYVGFIEKLPEEQQEQYLSYDEVTGKDTLHGGGDFHNAYLDLLAKSGALYAGTFFLLLFSLVYVSVRRINQSSESGKVATCYLIGLLAMTPFYSLLQDYAAYTIVFAATLAISSLSGNINES